MILVEPSDEYSVQIASYRKEFLESGEFYGRHRRS